ncbi:molybdopterin-dependent oxidoreductase [Nocardioides marmoraquaticus]
MTTVERAQGSATPAVRGPRATRWLLALAGVVAAACGLAVSEGVAWALRSETTPVDAVAASVRDLTPGPVVELALRLLGEAGKPVLLTGTVVAVLLLVGYAASWSQRAPAVPGVVLLVLAGTGLAAVLSRTAPAMGAVLSVLAGLATWAVVLRVLGAPLLSPAAAVSESRRRFLQRAALAVLVSGVVAVAGRAAGGARRSVEAARRLLRLPVTPVVVPGGASLGVDGVAPWRTPVDDFYVIHTAIAPPAIRPEEWRLRIHGMVERELTVSYEDLVARGLSETWVTLTCVSNPVGGDLVGNARWSGVPVRELLAEAGPLPGADAVLQTSADGWTCGTPLAALTDDRDALLALAMDGEPLPVEHGFPVRVVVPGLYGYVSATKWVVDLEVSRYDEISAYWTDRGWGEKGPIKTMSRIDVPRDGDSVASGSVTVAGVAWAQHTGIEAVEVQVDGGPWQQARLGRVPSADTWVQWALAVDVGPGEHEVVCCATDTSGETQTAAVADVLPDGATGWPSVRFEAG